MQKLLVRSTILGVALLFAAVVVPLPVLAQEGETGDETTTTLIREGDSDKVEQKRKKLQEAQLERKANQQARLNETKLRVCENREANINAIMKRSVARAEKHIGVFDKISTRVQEFYVNKGKTLANYDQLVAAVVDAKTEAEGTLEHLKTQTFSCDSEDPKGDIEAFKTDMANLREELKAYRTAVKNLIVGVKSVQSTTSQEGGSDE